MSTKDAIGEGRLPEKANQRFFTAETANDALVLVRQVVEDTVTAYRELMRLRGERQERGLVAGRQEGLNDLRARIDRQVERLEEFHQELVGVGCQLKDFCEGLVDFPALLADRNVLLCWKLGEPEVAYWHEVHAGFAGRQPIDAAFRVKLVSREA